MLFQKSHTSKLERPDCQSSKLDTNTRYATTKWKKSISESTVPKTHVLDTKSLMYIRVLWLHSVRNNANNEEYLTTRLITVFQLLPHNLALEGASILILCQELLRTPLRFQMSSISAGWTLAAVSTCKYHIKNYLGALSFTSFKYTK